MGKPHKKKRRRSSSSLQHNVDLLCNVTGLEGIAPAHGDDSMEACLAEFEVQQDEAPLQNEKPATNTSERVASRPTLATLNVFKTALRGWVKTGKYTDRLPNPQVEVTRHFHTEALSSFLLKKCPALRMPAFERWWIDSKCEEYYSRSSSDDPVIPCRPSLESDACQRLLEEILYSDDNMTLEQAQDIVRELCIKTKYAVQQVSIMASRRLAPFSKGSHVVLEKGSSQHTICYKRKSWKKPYSVQVNVTHYDKLWNAFCSVYPSLKHEKHVLPVFHALVFCLLLRYSSLSGGHLLNDLRGGGMQGAVMPDVFDVSQHFFPSDDVMECFASPWNAHLPSYASAFPDLDAHFGAVGDFRELEFRKGVYEANPPFSPGLMIQMACRMKECLSLANDESKALTFLVIVPTGNVDDDSTPPTKKHAEQSFSAMISSPYCRLHIVLPSRQHGYVEGAQHLRPTRFKQSPYDTSLILLQSDAAHEHFSSRRKSFEKKMRKAFASRHEEELQGRRQERDGG